MPDLPNSINPQRDPNALYTFDSERDASQSEICRQGKGKQCIIVCLFSRYCLSQAELMTLKIFELKKKKKGSDDLQRVI